MKQLWSKHVPLDAPWEPDYAGVFCSIREKVHFLFKNGKNVGVLREDSDAVQILSTAEKSIPLPNNWLLAQAGERALLFFSEDMYLDVSELKIVQTVESALREVDRKYRKPEMYYVEADFCHDGYCISHKGNFGYRCVKDGELLWEFRGQGYLYTDICFRADRVFFGTAGQGGYFYVLDLKTGEPLAKIKTGGTASFVTAENCCYVLTNEKATKLLCVDLTDGSIRSGVELQGRSSVYSRLRLMDGKVHAITFSYKNRALQQAIWNCIEV